MMDRAGQRAKEDQELARPASDPDQSTKVLQPAEGKAGMPSGTVQQRANPGPQRRHR